MKRRWLGVSALLAAVLWALPGWALPPNPPGSNFTATDSPAVAAVFTPQTGQWTTTTNGYGGTADGNWCYALATAPDSNYTLTATIMLVKPADRQDGVELCAFRTFDNLANLGGYEAGLLVRYQASNQLYRVALSSTWKEVVIWKPNGGIVQVAPYEFTVGKSYRLAVTCTGPTLSVAVDDQALLTWTDTAAPLLAGTVGLARKEGAAAFTMVTLMNLPAAAPAGNAPHLPKFREQLWHKMRWYFDGNEPVCTLLPNNVFDLMKFRPGYRPILYAYNYITDWSRFYPSMGTDYKLVESGDRLVIETKAVDPKTKTTITQDARTVISYDPARNSYVYDSTCITHLPAEEADKVGEAWDHGDPCVLGVVGSSITRDPKSVKPVYRWSVFQSTDGKMYKVPFNHNGFYIGTAESNGGPLQPGGTGWVQVGDPLLSPVEQVPELSTNVASISVGHCWWAYDMHTIFTPKKVNGKIPAGDYTTHVRHFGIPATEAQALLAKAEFYKPLTVDQPIQIPIYTAGTGLGLVEPFDTVIPLATPTGAHRIWAGVIDNQVGHGDHSSLRLDGPTEAWTLTGPSYYTGRYGKKARISAWVKTQDVQGEGPTFGLHRRDNNTYEFHTTGLTGTHDWTEITYVTTFPGDSFGVDIFWRNSGSGTVWVDDFSVTTLDDTAAVEPPVHNYTPHLADTDIVLKWADKGTTNSVFDLSGYGHHGKFFGDATWAEEDGARVLVLGGKTSYICPLASPNLTLGPGSTLVFDFKPEPNGSLLVWGFAFNYTLGSGPQIPIGYYARGKNVLTAPLLTAGQWQKLAILVGKDTISYYVNGNLAGTSTAPTFPGDPSTFLGSTWHRHLCLFGAGPGDIGLVPEGPSATFKGKVRGVTIYKRALTAEEIGK